MEAKGSMLACLPFSIILLIYYTAETSIVTACNTEQVILPALSRSFDCVDICEYGYSIAAWGHTVAVGNYRQTYSDGLIPPVDTAGQVYIFQRNSATGEYEEFQNLTAIDPGNPTGHVSYAFGFAIAMSEQHIAVSNDVADYVFIFSRLNGDPTAPFVKVQHLNDIGSYSYMAQSLAMYESTLVIGTGIVNRDINIGGYENDAIVYQETAPGVWSKQLVLNGTGGNDDEYFSYSLAIWDDVVVAGAPMNNLLGFGSGTAYLFKASTTDWSSATMQELQPGTLSNSDRYGYSVAVREATVAVGAYGVQAYYAMGAVFIFGEVSPNTWSLTLQINPDMTQGIYFGASVSLSSRFLAVGWPGDDELATSSGAVYLYSDIYDGTANSFVKLVAGNGQAFAEFGRSLSLSEHVLAIGAPRETPGDAYIIKNLCGTDVDECVSNPCLNAGVCETGALGTYDETFECDCTNTGYEGSICETGLQVFPCESSPCLNNGTCDSTFEGEVACNCSDTGYEGQFCETDVNECASSPCLHTGVCTDAGTFAFTCDCADTGFEGGICEIDINECASSPCSNGICNDSVFSYECICFAGFSGIHCDEDIDDCISAPCLNGGICTDMGPGAFTCNCSAISYEGELCETEVVEEAPVIASCKSDPCLNDGRCSDGADDTFMCNCTGTGYEGDICEINIDDCVMNACQNEAPCIDQVLGYTCDCSSVVGFTGEFCDITIEACESSPCANWATCYSVGSGSLASFFCECAADYTGDLCEDAVEVISSSVEETCDVCVTSFAISVTSFVDDDVTPETFAVELPVLLAAELGGRPSDYIVELVPVDSSTVITYQVTVKDSVYVEETQVTALSDADSTLVPHIENFDVNDVSIVQSIPEDEDTDSSTDDNSTLLLVVFALAGSIAALAIWYYVWKNHLKKKTGVLSIASKQNQSDKLVIPI